MVRVMFDCFNPDNCGVKVHSSLCDVNPTEVGTLVKYMHAYGASDISVETLDGGQLAGSTPGGILWWINPN